MTSEEWEEIERKKRDMLDIMSRLSTDQTFGLVLPKYLINASIYLESLPDRKWNDQEVTKLRDRANDIKDLTATIKMVIS